MDNGWQVSRPRRIKKGRKYVRYALQYRKPDRNEETLGMWTSCAKEILFRSLVGVAHQRYPASVCLQLPIRLPSLPVSKALSKAEPLEKMFKRKAVLTQVLYEEKAVYEAINKLASACNKASVHQLRWAKVEENSYFFSLFGRLAELNWIWSEALKQIADKHHTFSKVFRDIYQEERIVEDARKALQSCAGRLSKLQKQLDAAKKKNDSTKTATLEVELATQSSLQDVLAASVDGQSQKLERYKLDLIKKGLRAQSEGMMTMMTGHCSSLIQAQMQLVELLPDKTTTDATGDDVEQQMQAVVQQVAESLNIYPPPNGGIDVKKLTSPSPTQSPANFRRSILEPLAVDSSGPTSLNAKQASIAPESPTNGRSQRQSCHSSRPLPKRPAPLSLDPAHPLPEKDSPDGYTEIDILEDPKDKEALYAEARHCIVLRRTQTNSTESSPSSNRRIVQKRKHLSTTSLDEQHQEGKALKVGEPDSSSSEDCTMENTKGPEYAMVRIRSHSSESQESDDGGYANPIDALRQCFDSGQNLLEGGGGGVGEGGEEQGASDGSGEEGGREKEGVGDGVEGRNRRPPHQSSDDNIRKLRELQIQGKESSGNASDNPVYSRPFDALFGVAEPLKVTPDASRRKLNISPLPWQRTNSSSEPKVPRSPLLDRQMKFSSGTERLAVGSQGSSSSLTETSSETTVRMRDYRRGSEPETYLDHPPLPPMRKEQGGGKKRPTFNGQPHPAANLGHIVRPRSQSESLTPEESLSQERDTTGNVLDPRAVSDIYDHENDEGGIKPSDVRAKKVGWLERTVSEASTKKLKPASVKKLRSGQARLISPKSLRKKQISDSN